MGRLENLNVPINVKQFANCIFLVDRVDILILTTCKNNTNVLFETDGIIKVINSLKGTWFNPEIVDSFNQVASLEAFWLGLENVDGNKESLSWVSQSGLQKIAFDDVKQLINIFSSIVDAKSSFTHDHSDGVGNLARYIGGCMNLSDIQCDKLEIAGLLHDIGKLRTPDDYLEKPSKLSDEEFSMLKQHSFDTYKILSTIEGLEDVALWASQHHEHIDGTGYPWHLKGNELALEAKILAVADCFQALAQNRP